MNAVVFFGSALVVGLLLISQIPRIERFRAKHLMPFTDRLLKRMLTEEQIRNLDRHLRI